MNELELERGQWLGVLGAGVMAAVVTAMAMPWASAQDQAVSVQPQVQSSAMSQAAMAPAAERAAAANAR